MTQNTDYRFNNFLFYGVILCLTYLVFRVFEPFLTPLGWAAVFGVLFHSLNKRFEKKWGSTRAAALITLGVTLILIIPAVATAPALVIVGVFMIQGLAELDLRDFEKAVPAFITILAMPLAFSISEGIAFGLLTYVGLKVGTGKSKDVGVVTYALAVLFILHFLFGR